MLFFTTAGNAFTSMMIVLVALSGSQSSSAGIATQLYFVYKNKLVQGDNYCPMDMPAQIIVNCMQAFLQ